MSACTYEVRAMFDPAFADVTKSVTLSKHPTPGEAATTLAIGRLIIVANEGGKVRALTVEEGEDALSVYEEHHEEAWEAWR